MNFRPASILLFVTLLASAVPARLSAADWELSGRVGAEVRAFADAPQFASQKDGAQGSLLLEPELDGEFAERRLRFRLVPFLRLDGVDEERTHFDLREGYVEYVADEWELLVGAGKVFWGVTESRHLVDVVNQVDVVENVDEEDRLGQPMIRLATQRSWGRIEFYGLTGFRERTYPGTEGRLRTPLPVAGDRARYESSREQLRLDQALRWSHYLGDWDLGLSYFDGTSREARLSPNAGGTELIPQYDLIRQLALDVQYTRGAWLWKLEALGRKAHQDDFLAGVGGFEYTFYQVKGAADLGVLFEYLYDGRGTISPVTVFDDDLFAGVRLALNDTQNTTLLLGSVIDRDDGSTSGLLEAERRLGRHVTVELEVRWFSNVDDGNPLQALDRDSFAALTLSRHF